jgi:hypothetical protein
MPKKRRSAELRLRQLVVRGGLVRPHVYLGPSKTKTSISLEPVIWEALQEIAAHEGKTIHQLVNEIDRTRAITLSAAIRVYIVEFYRSRVRL